MAAVTGVTSSLPKGGSRAVLAVATVGWLLVELLRGWTPLLIASPPTSDTVVAPERGIRVAMIAYDADVRDDLAELMAGVAASDLHLEIEHVYPFDQAVEALARVQTRHVRGKLVLSV